MRPPRTLAVWAATGVGTMLIAIAGCTGDGSNAAPPEPTATTTPTPSASQSPSPTVAPPEMPAKAKANTDAGAEAFVRYYVKLVNHAAATGDVTEMRRVAPHCDDCNRVADLIATAWQNGTIDPARIWRPVEIFAIPGEKVVVASIKEPAITFNPSPGASPSTTEGAEALIEFHLKHAPTGWHITKAIRT